MLASETPTAIAKSPFMYSSTPLNAPYSAPAAYFPETCFLSSTGLFWINAKLSAKVATATSLNVMIMI